jgi:hypothetical protein
VTGGLTFFDPGGRAVGRAVVHHDDFVPVGRIFTRTEAFKTRVDAVGLVAGRDDDGDGRPGVRDGGGRRLSYANEAECGGGHLQDVADDDNCKNDEHERGHEGNRRRVSAY